MSRRGPLKIVGPKPKFFPTGGPNNACGPTVADAVAVRISLSALDKQKPERSPAPLRWQAARQHLTPLCFDSLGDLNFMEELLMVVWTIRQIDCWIIGG
jgi:hypothetical protein